MSYFRACRPGKPLFCLATGLRYDTLFAHTIDVDLGRNCLYSTHMPANNGAAKSSTSEDTTMTQKFTISARNADRYLGDDEAHVGEYAGKLLTFAEACDAIVHLNRSRPDGHENVVYVANETDEPAESGLLTQEQRDTFRLALASHYALGAADVGIDDFITDDDVVETLDTVEDFFVANGRRLTRSGERPAVPAELRKTPHGALLVWDGVQARKGTRRGTLYVMDCGTARAAYFDGEA